VWTQYLATIKEVNEDNLKVHAAVIIFALQNYPDLLPVLVESALNEVKPNENVKLLSVCIGLWQLQTE
jgi:hypothetical protein